MTVTTELAVIARQEAELTFARFDEDSAWRLGSLIRDWALAAGWPIVIEIRFFHRALFYAALPGSAPDNADWVRRKRNVVERYHRSSFGVGRSLAEKGGTLESRYGLAAADFAAHGGAFPITVAGCGVIGCAAVSGLPQREDHMLVVRAICALLERDPADLALPEG